MSFASGFFNSVDHDRLYDATDISRLFDGLIRDGIFASIGDCLIVKPSNGMTVTVGTGRAWFNHTWSYNDALYPVTVPASEILTKRIDAIVLEINSVESVRANSIKLVKGTPAANPSKPSLTNTKEVHQYPLAYITVEKEVTSIRQADIENCVGTNVCPFVSGILDVISIDKLIPQWKDTLNRFVETNTTNFNTWMNGEKQNYQTWLASAKKEITDWENSAKSDYNTWYTGIKNSYNTWYNSVKNSYDQWFATIKAAYNTNWATFQQWEKDSQAQFDTWFDNIKNKLEGDLATKLTQEVENLGKEKVSLIESEDKILKGTVEAPLLLANATRNLLNPTLLSIRENDFKDSGVTAVLNSDGSVTLNGTASKTIWTVLLVKSASDARVFEGLRVYSSHVYRENNTSAILYAAMLLNGDGTKEQWVSRPNGNAIRKISDNEHFWIRLYIVKGATFNNEKFWIMFTNDESSNVNTNFVPYSGYEIKTCGRNLLNPISVGNNIKVTDDVISAIDTITDLRTWVYANGNFELNLSPGSYDMIFNVLKGDTATSYKAAQIISENNEVQGIVGNNSFVNTGTFYRSFNIKTNMKHRLMIKLGTATCNIAIVKNGSQSIYTRYQDGGSVTITNDTKFPNLDLKTFDGTTNILSTGNVKTFHADADNGKYLLEAVKKSSESGGVSVGTTQPTNPKVGDLWVDTKYSSIWLRYWNGTGWGTIQSQISAGSTMPSSPFPGQAHYDPSTKKMYVYIAYGGSWGGPGWYAVGSDDPGGYYYGSSAPSNTKLLWIDTSGVAKYYNGSAWKAITATWG